MNVNSIKANLRNIVLLAKEYKECIQEKDEISSTAQTTLKQVDFFSKRILSEFELRGKKEFEIDYNQAKKVRRKLSPDELYLLKYIYDMQINNHYLGIDEAGAYKEVKIEEIVTGLNEFVEKTAGFPKIFLGF